VNCVLGIVRKALKAVGSSLACFDLRLEREARAAADAARAASGGGMEEGHGEESEEEHDVLRTYMEIYDNNFDYDF
jgi:hypothetical protein